MWMESDALDVTTLGDLIVALTDEAGRYLGDDKKACEIVALLLSHLMNYLGPVSKTWH